MGNFSELKQQILLWIEIALDDFHASKILYTSKQYRTSYSLFQQSVEKANKAFALFSGKAIESDLKDKYGHNHIKFYRKSLVAQKDEAQKLITTLEAFPKARDHSLMKPLDLANYKQSIDNGLQFIDKTNTFDMVNISIDIIHDVLDELYEIEFQKINFPKDSEKHFLETLRDCADWVGQFEIETAKAGKKEIEEFIGKEENIEALKEMLKIYTRFLNTVPFIFSTFLACAFFTNDHWSLTRYPETNKNPLRIYTKKLPLIKEQEEIMDVFEIALKKFKRFVNANC